MSLDPFEIAFDGSVSPQASSVSSPACSARELLDKESVSEEVNHYQQNTVNIEDGEENDDIPKYENDDEEEIDGIPKYENDDEDDDDENVDASFRKSCQEQRAEKEKVNAILAQFTPEQMERYESYRRARFRRANMKKVLQTVAGCPVSKNMTILMSGIAKIYVGDLVENSRILMAQRNVTGPIRPCDLREAYRRLDLEGKIPKLSRQRLFRS